MPHRSSISAPESSQNVGTITLATKGCSLSSHLSPSISSVLLTSQAQSSCICIDAHPSCLLPTPKSTKSKTPPRSPPSHTDIPSQSICQTASQTLYTMQKHSASTMRFKTLAWESINGNYSSWSDLGGVWIICGRLSLR